LALKNGIPVLIGQGSYGKVYKGFRWTEPQKILAVKQNFIQDDDEDLSEELRWKVIKWHLNEIKALKFIKSDYVVKMIDAFIEDKGDTTIVMEYIDGFELK